MATFLKQNARPTVCSIMYKRPQCKILRQFSEQLFLELIQVKTFERDEKLYSISLINLLHSVLL